MEEEHRRSVWSISRRQDEDARASATSTEPLGPRTEEADDPTQGGGGVPSVGPFEEQVYEIARVVGILPTLSVMTGMA